MFDGKGIPAPARDFDISPDTTDVIYAEDEDVFRETAVSELLKVGFLRLRCTRCSRYNMYIRIIYTVYVYGRSSNMLYMEMKITY